MELKKMYKAHTPPKYGSPNGSINFIDIEPNNFYFATASDDKTVKIWALENFYDYEMGALIVTLPEQERIINFVKFFDNGNLLLTVNWDGYIRLYERSRDWLTYEEIDCFFKTKTSQHTRLYERNVQQFDDNILILKYNDSSGNLIIKIDLKIKKIEEINTYDKSSVKIFMQDDTPLVPHILSQNKDRKISSRLSKNQRFFIEGYHNGNLKIYCDEIKSPEIIFYVCDTEGYCPKVRPNSCFLHLIDWNDFNYFTFFNLHYYDEDLVFHNIGRLKIANINMPELEDEKTSSILDFIPKMFYSLSSDFCSLGEDENYYAEIKNLRSEKILKSLNDIVPMKIHDSQKYKESVAYKISLLRYTTENNIRTVYVEALLGKIKPLDYEFAFKTKDKNTILNVKVDPDSIIPTNIHAVIGRNGSGKTRLLSGIADSLTEVKENYSLEGSLEFKNSDYRFVNLLVIAFSVFDNFNPIESKNIQNKVKYEYIGLKERPNNSIDKDETSKNICFKNIKDLEDDFISSLLSCFEKNIRQQWIDIIKILENSDGNFASIKLSKLDSFNNDNNNDKIREVFRNLSSGHKIILYTITKLALLTRDKTLILIDEPENHLHPPLLSGFIRTISNLLKQRNAVAIIATHSPIVLQEIPKSCVNVIAKISDSNFNIRRLDEETFGENVGTLTREVFGLDVEKSGFYTLIKSELEKITYEEFKEKVHNQLGTEANLYARFISHNNESNNV